MSNEPHAIKCSPEEEKRLLAESEAAKQFSYSPYSSFPVGAALLTKSGKIYTGCNVENAVFPVCVCAERTAIVKAVSEGEREFKAIAVSSNMKDSVITPCGPCRQTMAEFSLDMLVYMTRPDGTFQINTVEELLPFAFTPVRLQEARVSQEGESTTTTTTPAITSATAPTANNCPMGDSSQSMKTP